MTTLSVEIFYSHFKSKNDLAAADIYQKEFEIRAKSSQAADLTEQLTLNQYKAGTVDFTTVVVEQTAALNSRLQLAQIRISRPPRSSVTRSSGKLVMPQKPTISSWVIPM